MNSNEILDLNNMYAIPVTNYETYTSLGGYTVSLYGTEKSVTINDSGIYTHHFSRKYVFANSDEFYHECPVFLSRGSTTSIVVDGISSSASSDQINYTNNSLTGSFSKNNGSIVLSTYGVDNDEVATWGNNSFYDVGQLMFDSYFTHPKSSIQMVKSTSFSTLYLQEFVHPQQLTGIQLYHYSSSIISFTAVEVFTKDEEDIHQSLGVQNVTTIGEYFTYNIPQNTTSTSYIIKLTSKLFGSEYKMLLTGIKYTN